MSHATCDDPTCAACRERERLAALDLQRGLRPGGRIQQTLAKIRERAKSISKA